jgi:hypothetical protein
MQAICFGQLDAEDIKDQILAVAAKEQAALILSNAGVEVISIRVDHLQGIRTMKRIIASVSSKIGFEVMGVSDIVVTTLIIRIKEIAEFLRTNK